MTVGCSAFKSCLTEHRGIFFIGKISGSLNWKISSKSGGGSCRIRNILAWGETNGVGQELCSAILYHKWKCTLLKSIVSTENDLKSSNTKATNNPIPAFTKQSSVFEEGRKLLSLTLVSCAKGAVFARAP